jgi:NADPH-dependent glutamate synthase beta subunit-like oxidoreductase
MWNNHAMSSHSAVTPLQRFHANRHLLGNYPPHCEDDYGEQDEEEEQIDIDNDAVRGGRGLPQVELVPLQNPFHSESQRVCFLQRVPMLTLEDGKESWHDKIMYAMECFIYIFNHVR